jgi:hypothetical protein
MEKEWCDLFDEAPGIDDSNENAIEVFTAVLLDLYEMMTDYFIKHCSFLLRDRKKLNTSSLI